MLFVFQLFGQSTTKTNLELIDKGKKIDNVIEFSISTNNYAQMKNTDGNSISLNSKILKINNDFIVPKDIHTRGQTTQYYRRKSLSFSLDSKAKIIQGDDTLGMKKFEAISLSMDNFYYRNRLAFGLLKKLNLFNLFYAYGDIKINDEHAGVYLLLQRPQDWAFNMKDSPILIRRGYDHKIEKIKTDKKVDKSEIKAYRKTFSEIYKLLNDFDGERLYQELSKLLDIEMYMKWLAFNYFFKNGDYTDEVFFYIDPTDEKFRIIPWDYDDIFSNTPHEGRKEKYDKIGDKFLFSSEDELDRKIANDNFLYEHYLKQLKTVALQLDESVLKEVFENTYAELYPYYSNPDIISMAQYDSHPTVSIPLLKKSLEESYAYLLMSRTVILNQLKN